MRRSRKQVCNLPNASPLSFPGLISLLPKPVFPNHVRISYVSIEYRLSFLVGCCISGILLKAPPQVDPEEEYEMATVRPADFAKAKQQKEREEMDRYVFSEQNLHLKQFG